MQNHQPNVSSHHVSFASISKPSSVGDATGFSHGAFSSNHHPQHHHNHIGAGYGERQTRRGNLPPSLNSAAFGQNQRGNIGDMTPGTGYDMNFTPLLPSQLLLGSPFQPGSPSSFASPQFASFGTFQQQAGNQLNQPALLNNSLQNQASMSPNPYQTMDSPTFGSFGVPQSPTFNGVGQSFSSQGGINVAPGMVQGTSRTVYLGNIPPDTSAEEILSHVRSGPIESVRLLPDKNCAFISFLDGSSATHFHSDAILKKLSIRAQDIKIGWGKPSQVPTSVALAVQQSGASRNVYLGNLPDEVTEAELKEDLGKYGAIDTVKIVREKSIGFVHFLSIGNAIKAVSQLPQEPKWQAPRRVYYGKDRCAYVSKTQQQNAAQYLGIAPGFAHVLNGADRDLISNVLAQQSVAAAAVATTAGGASNLGNRTVYLGNIHPETTIEEICNVVRGGLLHHIRYIPDKHICFVTFIDPTAAASFYALSNIQGLMIHNRRLKIGWGKHSGALPPAIALAVSGGASRNVYIGNLDETWTEERLKQDFSEYGEIELVNALREKSCAFVNFTNIANAIKAIEGMRGREEYKRFKINFGKDRCGNPPRQNNAQGQQQQGQPNGRDSTTQSPLNSNMPNGSTSPSRTAFSPPPGSTGSRSQSGNQPQVGPTASTILNAGSNNPLTMYLNQVLQHQSQQVQQQQAQQQIVGSPEEVRPPTDPYTVAALHQQQQSALANQQAALYGGSAATNDLLTGSVVEAPPSASSGSYPAGVIAGANVTAAPSSNSQTVGGLLAPTAVSRVGAQHSRAVSLPVFAPDQATAQQQQQHQQHQQQQMQQQLPAQQGAASVTQGLSAMQIGGFGGSGLGHSHQQSQGHGPFSGSTGGTGLQLPTHRQQQSSFGGMSSGFGGFGNAGFGLAIGSGDGLGGGLRSWAANDKLQ